jgi:hypothetical protein
MCLANGSSKKRKQTPMMFHFGAQKMANQREMLAKNVEIKRTTERTDSKRTCDKNEKLVKSP